MRRDLKNFSKIVSNIFNFYTWMPIAIFLGIFKAGIRTEHIKTTLGVLLFLDVICPVLTYLFLLDGGKISDGSLIKREDRPLLFGATVIFIFFGTIVSYFLGSALFFKFHILIFAFMLTLFSITMFFKISGHAFLNTYFIFILNFLFGWQFLWLFAIAPVVYFARLYLKAHTPLEVIAGATLGLAEPYVLLKLLNLL